MQAGRHSDNVTVTKILAEKTNSKDRRVMLELLQNGENFIHNKMVLAAWEGELIPVRRPPAATSANDFMPCQTCLGLFATEDLHRHAAYHCVPGAEEEASSSVHTGELRMESSILKGEGISSLKEVLLIVSKMKQDHVTMVIKHDMLIVELGDNLARKCAALDDQKRHHYVSQKMCECAKLLIDFRETG